MKRAIVIALAAGLVISSAAALDIAGAGDPAAPAAEGDLVQMSRMRESARQGQRERGDSGLPHGPRSSLAHSSAGPAPAHLQMCIESVHMFGRSPTIYPQRSR